MHPEKIENPDGVGARTEVGTHGQREHPNSATARPAQVAAPYSWFRFYSEFASDPKVQLMSEAMQRRLVMLMCLRCGDVTVTVDVTERDAAVALVLRIDEEELAKTKALFIQKKFIDEQWNLLNWDKRQKPSDSSAERMRRKRAKDSANAKSDGGIRHNDGVTCDDVRRHSDATEETRERRRVEEKEQEISLSVGKSEPRDSRATPDAAPTARADFGKRSGEIAKLLRTAGIPHVNPSHSKIIELAATDATDDEITNTAKEAIERGSPNLGWVCSAILGRKREAAANPQAKPKPTTGSGAHKLYVPEKRAKRDPALGAPAPFAAIAAQLGIGKKSEDSTSELQA